MEDITLQLVKLGLNMHLTTQQVASQNIAKYELASRSEVDFTALLEQIKNAPESQKLALVESVNREGIGALEQYVKVTDHSVDLQKAHTSSTKAVLEYETLVEALNRKMAIKSLVYGGRS